MIFLECHYQTLAYEKIDVQLLHASSQNSGAIDM